jgi:putative nucleotide binding protein
MLAEEYGRILDYLPQGRSTSYKGEPLAQVVGESYFTLLEVVPKGEVKILERVYLGKEERDKVEFVRGRISFKDLTNTAQGELENALVEIVNANPQRFLDFFNKSGPISLRTHQLDMLPGIGSKHTQEILQAREEKSFESFEDIKKRVSFMPDPVKIVVRRVLMELREEHLKHYLFARPPKKPFSGRKRFGKR